MGDEYYHDIIQLTLFLTILEHKLKTAHLYFLDVYAHSLILQSELAQIIWYYAPP